jgi:phosphoribosylformylglycinamidine cyclo-ligase
VTGAADRADGADRASDPGPAENRPENGAVPAGGLSYAAAGVDIGAGDRAVDLMRASVARTARPEVIGDIGGFAGLFDAAKLASYRHPVLATSTDGVGTKVVIARRLGIYDTVGVDLVAMVADDLAACGAEPLFMTDYVVCGAVRPEQVAAIVSGVAQGCAEAGCALLGGETAEHPGHFGPDDFDLAGAATGVVEKDEILGASRVRAGDTVIAMASSGLHSNGYSLVREIVRRAGLDLEQDVPELGRPLGEELLTPSRIYARDCLALAAACDVHAYAHITGGGLAANLARVMPPGVDAALDRATWTPPPIFGVLADAGAVPAAEMDRVFNMGVGMTAVVAREDTDQALGVLEARGVNAWVLGEVVLARGATPGTPATRCSSPGGRPPGPPATPRLWCSPGHRALARPGGPGSRPVGASLRRSVTCCGAR